MQKLPAVDEYYQFKNLKVQAAFPSSDMVWKNLGKSDCTTRTKLIAFFILITILSFLILTPTVVLSVVARVSSWTNTEKFIV